MEMSMEIADQEECLDFSNDAWWNELPVDLHEQALAWLRVHGVESTGLAWLPVDSFLTYSTVYKDWNTLLSSSKFLSGLSAKVTTNMNPWLLLWQQSSTERGHAFFFYIGTWKVSFSFSFLTMSMFHS